MTAGEQIQQAWRQMTEAWSAMNAQALLLNLGLTILILVAAVLLGAIARKLLVNLVRRIPGPPNADKHVRSGRVARFSTFVVRAILAAAAVLLLAELWGLDLRAFLIASVGEAAAASVARLIMLLLIGVAAYELVGFGVNLGMSRLRRRARNRRRKVQLDTLGPLLKGIAQTVVAVIAVLMGLGEIGVKIGPLLAGAGVVGIAVGFGAQTLVKDFLTGLFLIAEDIVSVGDIVRIGDSSGLVERMTLRTIRLRDFDGTLHVLPYGEAQVVHNLTKTFSYYVFDLQISYGSDIDRALQTMRAVGDELHADPAFAEKILEPIEVVGVDSLADSGVVLKARIKTRPVEQWNVGREYNRRIKLAFDREGIEIPFPHMKVVLPEGQLAEIARH